MPRLGWGTGKDDDRGRSAPMQGVEYERPMDPGPFQVPNKREYRSSEFVSESGLLW